MLYTYSYLHLGPIFFKCIRSCPHFFLVQFIFFNLIQPWFFSRDLQNLYIKKKNYLKIYNILRKKMQKNWGCYIASDRGNIILFDIFIFLLHIIVYHHKKKKKKKRLLAQMSLITYNLFILMITTINGFNMLFQ